MNTRDRIRAEMWGRVYAGMAACSAPGAGGDKALAWADRAVEEFDKRFPPEPEPVIDWNKARGGKP